MSPVVGDPAASGARIVAAYTAITDAATDNRYVVLVEPGVYELASGLVTESYVDLVGSGESATILRSGGSVTLISMAGDTSIRNLTLEVADATTLTVLELPDGAAGRRLANVTISVVSTVTSDEVRGINDTTDDALVIDECTLDVQSAGDATAIRKTLGDLEIRDSAISASGRTTHAILGTSPSGALTIRNSQLSAAGGGGDPGRGIAAGSRVQLLDNVSITVTGGDSTWGIIWSNTLTMLDSELHAPALPALALVNFSGSATATIANSMIDGAVNTTTGLTCVNAYNGSFQALPADCQLP